MSQLNRLNALLAISFFDNRGSEECDSGAIMSQLRALHGFECYSHVNENMRPNGEAVRALVGRRAMLQRFEAGPNAQREQ